MQMMLTALIVFMTVGVILSANLLAQFGIEKDYLLIGLGAVVITGLVAYRGLALIIIILLLSMSINLPPDFLEQFYLDREILIVVTLLMVIFPLVYREFAGKR